jgi:hypothetical protein
MKLETDGSHGDRVKHATYRRLEPVARQCLTCGVLAECDPSRPCAACGASHFHLIPPPRELAEW